MNVTFRTDGSNRLGFGHLGRCRNLATELARLGYSHKFVRSGPKDQFLNELDVEWLDIEDCEVGSLRDAEMTLTTALGGAAGAPVVVVDNYRIDSSWESVVRKEGALVVAIDDLANRPHDCDVLIDASPLSAERYRGLAPAYTKCLLGPSFALLDPEVGDEHSQVVDSERDVQRVLVCFGGGENRMLIEMMLDACGDSRLSELDFDIVTANDTLSEDLQAARALAGHDFGSQSRVKIWGWVADLRTFLRGCDISVGAGGGLALERIRLGIPSVVVTLADNQVPTSREMHRRGLLRHVGDAKDCSPQRLAGEIHALVINQEARSFIRREGPQFIDGFGAMRCAREVNDARLRLEANKKTPPRSRPQDSPRRRTVR